MGKALGILEAVGAAATRLSLSEIADRCGLPISTAHRLIGELMAWGALERDTAGRYVLGLRLWQVGSLAPRALGLRQCAMPVLEDLYEATHQNVQLCVLDDLDALFVDRISGRSAVRVISRVGSRIPAYAASGGQVMLAFAPLALRKRAAAGPFTRYTAKTIGDGPELLAALAEIRQRGYAVCDGQITEGALAVAAPVRNAHEAVVAAVSVIVPSRPGAEIPLIPAVVAAARGISRALGAPSRTTRTPWAS